jgi:hypothetical protein
MARARQRLKQERQTDRLQQVVDRVHLESLQRIGVVGGGENDRRRLGEFLQMLRNLDAVDFRHADVEQHDVGIHRRNQFERVAAVIGLAGDFERNFQRAVTQQIAQTVARRRLVIDHQHAQRLQIAHARPIIIFARGVKRVP